MTPSHMANHWIVDALERGIKPSLEDEHSLFRSIVTHMNDAVLVTQAEPVVSPGPRIVYCNPSFTESTGYTLDEIIGKSPRILQGPRSDRATLDKIRSALQSWLPIVAELINYRKDGTEFWVEISIVPVADEAGWYTHWVAVQRDITMYRKEQDRINEIQRESDEVRRLVKRIKDLSTPILDIHPSVLLLPLIGELDAQRAEEMLGKLLERVVKSGALVVIMDISGVPTVDHTAVDHLFRSARALKLLGACTILCGVTPSVARTAMELGVDFLSTMQTNSDLHGALSAALRKLGHRIVKT